MIKIQANTPLFIAKNLLCALLFTTSSLSFATSDVSTTQFQQAEVLLKQEKYAQAFELLKSAAEAGHVPAQAELARQYMDEEADYFDYALAMQWAKKAAAANNPSGMNMSCSLGFWLLSSE